MTAAASGPVPLSDFPGPQRRASLLGQARIFRMAALLLWAVFGLSVLKWVVDGFRHDSMSVWGWVLGVPAAVGFVALIGLVPYGVADNYRRRATTRVTLMGTRLVVEDAKKREEVDLATAICHVWLTGGQRSNHRPEMLIHRDKDDIWPVRVPLCDVETQTMRPAEDLLLLAKVLDRSNREENHAAAGRLRTLATWKTLPRIYRADRDAIPITPPDEV